MIMNPFEQSKQQLLHALTSQVEQEVIDYIRQEMQHDAPDSIPTEEELFAFFQSPDEPTKLDAYQQILATDRPPTCVIRSASAPGRAPTASTAAYTRELGSPITASATAGSWATRLPSTSSRARASHGSARGCRSTTNGISASRSAGNPTTTP